MLTAPIFATAFAALTSVTDGDTVTIDRVHIRIANIDTRQLTPGEMSDCVLHVEGMLPAVGRWGLAERRLANLEALRSSTPIRTSSGRNAKLPLSLVHVSGLPPAMPRRSPRAVILKQSTS